MNLLEDNPNHSGALFEKSICLKETNKYKEAYKAICTCQSIDYDPDKVELEKEIKELCESEINSLDMKQETPTTQALNQLMEAIVHHKFQTFQIFQI